VFKGTGFTIGARVSFYYYVPVQCALCSAREWGRARNLFNNKTNPVRPRAQGFRGYGWHEKQDMRIVLGQTPAKHTKKKRRSITGAGLSADEDLQHVELIAGLITPSSSPTLLDEGDIINCLFGS